MKTLPMWFPPAERVAAVIQSARAELARRYAKRGNAAALVAQRGFAAEQAELDRPVKSAGAWRAALEVECPTLVLVEEPFPLVRRALVGGRT